MLILQIDGSFFTAALRNAGLAIIFTSNAAEQTFALRCGFAIQYCMIRFDTRWLKNVRYQVFVTT